MDRRSFIAATSAASAALACRPLVGYSLEDAATTNWPQWRGPNRDCQVRSEVWPGIGADDKILLWGGGLWPWLDPVSAIDAVAQVIDTHPTVRLIFPGTRHPNPIMAGMPTKNAEAMDRAQELGLIDQHVFFGDWVAYADWPSLLLECDLALSLHFDSIETQLAFRSRVLDYIWAGLPIVATRGDATSELVKEHGLGLVVEYQDSREIAAAIVRLLDEPAAARAPQFVHARSLYTWENAAQPLLHFCHHPLRSAARASAGGPPFYTAQLAEQRRELAALKAENARLSTLVEGYAQGRVMRALAALQRMRAALPPRGEH